MGPGKLTKVMTHVLLASSLQKGGGEDSVLRTLPEQCCLQFKLLLNEGVGMQQLDDQRPCIARWEMAATASSLPPEVHCAAFNNCLPL